MSLFKNLGDALSPGATPDQLALVDLGGGRERRFTYHDVAAKSGVAANGFRAIGLVPGDVVAILASNGADYLFALFGALRAGLVVVPVNHKLPAASARFILQGAGARLVVHDEAMAGLVPPGISTCGFEAVFRDAAIVGPAPEPIAPQPGDVAMILYTSGSTGEPKGVRFSHLGHLWALEQRVGPATPRGQTTIVAAPLYHQNGLASAQAALASGGTVILLPQFTPESFVEAIAGHGVTMVTAVPAMIAMIARQPELWQGRDLSHVRLVRVSSAPSTPELLARIAQIFPEACIINGYGTTEGGPVFFGPHPDGLEQPTSSVGHAHPGVTLRLWRDGGTVEDEGVLQIRSPAQMLGYHARPDLTARAMTADGFTITGDIFRRDKNGFYHFLRRDDDMFTCGGENIFPGEVETMLRRHPAVEEACVVPIEDEVKSHKPVAFLILKPGHSVSAAQIKAFALEHAAAYQHPRHVWFLDALPVSSTNKIDRKALTAMAASHIAPRETVRGGS